MNTIVPFRIEDPYAEAVPSMPNLLKYFATHLASLIRQAHGIRTRRQSATGDSLQYAYTLGLIMEFQSAMIAYHNGNQYPMLLRLGHRIEQLRHELTLNPSYARQLAVSRELQHIEMWHAYLQM